MILSDKEIRKYVQNTVDPLIQPFVEANLQAASYDVSLSGNISVLKRTGRAIDPSTDSKEELDKMYEEMRISPAGYLFSPGEYLLAELEETVSIPPDLTAHIRPRTRFTRAGILIADQHCNPTYKGKLYIGLHNAGPNPVLLWPGLKIAQFVFEELTSVPSEHLWYKNKKDAEYLNEVKFRGSVFGGAVLTKERQAALQQKVLSCFDEEGQSK